MHWPRVPRPCQAMRAQFHVKSENNYKQQPQRSYLIAKRSSVPTSLHVQISTRFALRMMRSLTAMRTSTSGSSETSPVWSFRVFLNTLEDLSGGREKKRCCQSLQWKMLHARALLAPQAPSSLRQVLPATPSCLRWKMLHALAQHHTEMQQQRPGRR